MKGMKMENIANAGTEKICCMCCSEKFLMVGRESGILHYYNFLGLHHEGKETLHCRPYGNFSRFMPKIIGSLLCIRPCEIPLKYYSNDIKVYFKVYKVCSEEYISITLPQMVFIYSKNNKMY
jgi:hypothetical protein